MLNLKTTVDTLCEDVKAQCKELAEFTTAINKELPQQDNELKITLLDLSQTLYKSKNHFNFDKSEYKTSITEQFFDFIDNYKINDPKTLSALEEQRECLIRSTPENFHYLKNNAALYIGIIDKEIGKCFRNDIQLPVQNQTLKNTENTEIRKKLIANLA